MAQKRRYSQFGGEEKQSDSIWLQSGYDNGWMAQRADLLHKYSYYNDNNWNVVLDRGRVERWMDSNKACGRTANSLICSSALDKREETVEKVHSDAACVYSVPRRKSQCSRGSLGSRINTGAMMRQ